MIMITSPELTPLPKLLWPLGKVAGVTAAAAVGLPVVLLASGYGTLLVHDDAARIVVLLVIGAPGWVASWLVPRRLGTGLVLASTLVGMGLVVSTTALASADHIVLSARGREVSAVVVDRDVPPRGSSRCSLEQVDGTPVRPDLRAGCSGLEVGDPVRVVMDPDGEVEPQPAAWFRGDDGSSAMWTPAALCSLLVVLAGWRGRRRRRREALAWTPPAYLAAPVAPTETAPATPETPKTPAIPETRVSPYGAADDGLSFRAQKHRGRMVAVVVVITLVCLGVAAAGAVVAAVVLAAVLLVPVLAVAVLPPHGITVTPEDVWLHRLRTRRIPWHRVWSVEAAPLPKFAGLGPTERTVMIRLTDGTKLRSWLPADLARRPDHDFDTKVTALQRWHRRHQHVHVLAEQPA